MTVPTEEEFRAAGFTKAAINFPLSRRAFVWLCQFNGIAPAKAPRAWQYAPNAYMQQYLDKRAALKEKESLGMDDKPR